MVGRETLNFRGVQLLWLQYCKTNTSVFLFNSIGQQKGSKKVYQPTKIRISLQITFLTPQLLN